MDAFVSRISVFRYANSRQCVLPRLCLGHFCMPALPLFCCERNEMRCSSRVSIKGDIMEVTVLPPFTVP
jgi:hypothetical protein